MAASALLAYAYAQGAWPLGFVALVPWLLALEARRSWAATWLLAAAMTLAYSAAVFGWFGAAIGRYTQLGEATGVALLLLGAPLFQPQILAYALVRRALARRHGTALRALGAAAAWVASEALLPRLLGDTFGHGLQPTRLLRQGADLGGAPLLTVLLLLVNEAVAAACTRWRGGPRAWGPALALAALGPLLAAGYGLVALQRLPESAGGPRLRVALVQANIADYERLKRERGGTGAAVREVLDTHYAMSYDAVERRHADAVLWSETVYPTTFGHPKSEAGAELDREIVGIVEAARVPFVFGTYDVDAAGEYNAAAFVAPGGGLVGLYRKARPFPLTEQVPAWLDGPLLRRWLPWAGTWRGGDGARVFPLRLADGREVPVQPLICRDDMDAGLAIDGARLGAQAILTLSNDAWFGGTSRGAALHLAAAAFRSIETRLPQFRATTDGVSAVVDASGSVTASAPPGVRALVIGDAAVREPPRTLAVAWGDWVGRAAAALLLALALAAAARALRARFGAATPAPLAAAPALPAEVSVLPPAARVAAGALRALARTAVLGMALAEGLGAGGLQAHPLAQIRVFAALVLAPEIAAWCVLRAFAARASLDAGALVLSRGGRRVALALRDFVVAEFWRLPLPQPGLNLRHRDATRWSIAHPDPQALAAALAAAGAPAPIETTLTARVAAARVGTRLRRLDRPLVKFALFPLLLALPAFRLHQHIAYGGSFGEWQTYGFAAYATTLALWWAAWAIGVTLCAAVLRIAIEAGALLAVLLRPAGAAAARRALERAGLLLLYLGVPAWLAWRLAGG